MGCTVPVFQSTPSARRATRFAADALPPLDYFNPRSPWGGRPDKPKTPAPAKRFQSAISTWKATTDKLIVYDEAYMISIHALREEGDQHIRIQLTQIKDFNPRPPRGERLADMPLFFDAAEFQSTPSARRATFKSAEAPSNGINFNPRPPRGERQYKQRRRTQRE